MDTITIILASLFLIINTASIALFFMTGGRIDWQRDEFGWQLTINAPHNQEFAEGWDAAAYAAGNGENDGGSQE